MYEIKHDSTILKIPNKKGEPRFALFSHLTRWAHRRKLNAHALPWQPRWIVAKSASDARAPRDAARAIWMDKPRSVVANTPIPNARAVVAPGGYRVTGNQGFSTGCRHATWVAAHTQVYRDGEVQLRDGKVQGLYCFVPVEQAEIIDTWKVRGMRGTGTHHFVVNDVWEESLTKEAVSLERRVALRLSTTHAIRLAARMVESIYTACGATAAYESHIIQRHFQDIHVITQHVQGHLAHYETVGKHSLGLAIDQSRI